MFTGAPQCFLIPNGTICRVNMISSFWFDYTPNRIRFMCNSMWSGIKIAGNNGTIYENFDVNVGADEWHSIQLKGLYGGSSRIVHVSLYRNEDDPTPLNLGAVLYKIECGPQRSL